MDNVHSGSPVVAGGGSGGYPSSTGTPSPGQQQPGQHQPPPPPPASVMLNITSMQPGMQNERQVVRRAGRQAIRQFLEQHNCFSVLRASGKVVVFDTRIPIQLAFYALVEHDMQAAPLWDPALCQFVGLLTVTDFIDILRHYRATGKNVASLAERSIAEILADCTTTTTTTTTTTSSSGSAGEGSGGGDETKAPEEQPRQGAEDPSGAGAGPDDDNNKTTDTTTGGDENNNNDKSSSKKQQRPATTATKPRTVVPVRPFCGADSTCTLKRACWQLHENPGQDFLPVVFAEDMRVLACLTYTNILEHLVTHFREQRRLFDDSIYDLRIGTYGMENLITCRPHEPLSVALERMHAHGLSALPVLERDGSNKIMGVYARSDITFLTKATDANDAVRNLDLPVGDVLQQHRTDVTTPDALRTCSPSHTLQAIFESFAQVRFHRLYVVDDRDEQLLGVVSARDLVAYFLQNKEDDEQDLVMNNTTGAPPQVQLQHMQQQQQQVAAAAAGMNFGAAGTATTPPTTAVES